jgi:hypothetical protein
MPRRGNGRDKRQGDSLLHQVWRRFCPYLVALLVDFLISSCLWLTLFAFNGLTKTLAIDGWEGRIIIAVHSVTMVLAFATFGILFALDVIEIRKQPPKS